MRNIEIIDLSSDEEPADVGINPVKLEPDTYDTHTPRMQQNDCGYLREIGTAENRTLNSLSTAKKNALDQVHTPVDDTIVYPSFRSPPPICRQFWKAGNYNHRPSSKDSHQHVQHCRTSSKAYAQNGNNYLRVHPMFLHSNATSHKWAFGAIAELLDNAVDEIQNGATFVLVDKISNPRDGNPVLLIQDDGGGMDPHTMRHCLGFGFSDKKSNSTIGRYGNGFKTSTMRLGADVIVFSRHSKKGLSTLSIGLLSYTFLMGTGQDRIVVPIVDYEFNASTNKFKTMHSGDHLASNLSVLLEWSPFSSEAELLKQCDDIGTHGTKVIIFNLWFNDDEKFELDFDSDPEDICLTGDVKKILTRRNWQDVNEKHIANQFHYSLRVYLSILYLRVPESFKIMLRGKIVEHHNVVDDLKHPQYILYKPQNGGAVEGVVVTTIGFLKEAPQVLLHGFCVYHKNRLILPFWQVLSYSDSRGRGVVGVLEANFIEPTHDKQDFERTLLLQKLENRLKEMTREYWDFPCGLIGYHVGKKVRVSTTPAASSNGTPNARSHQQSSAVFKKGGPSLHAQPVATASSEQLVLQNGRSSIFSEVTLAPASLPLGSTMHTKRKGNPELLDSERFKRRAGAGLGVGNPVKNSGIEQSQNPKSLDLIRKNEKLRSRCLEYERRNKELQVKASQLRKRAGEWQREYERLVGEVESLDLVKDEKTVDRVV